MDFNLPYIRILHSESQLVEFVHWSIRPTETILNRSTDAKSFQDCQTGRRRAGLFHLRAGNLMGSVYFLNSIIWWNLTVLKHEQVYVISSWNKDAFLDYCHYYINSWPPCLPMKIVGRVFTLWKIFSDLYFSLVSYQFCA